MRACLLKLLLNINLIDNMVPTGPREQKQESWYLTEL